VPFEWPIERSTIENRTSAIAIRRAIESFDKVSDKSRQEKSRGRGGRKAETPCSCSVGTTIPPGKANHPRKRDLRRRPRGRHEAYGASKPNGTRHNATNGAMGERDGSRSGLIVPQTKPANGAARSRGVGKGTIR